MNTSYIYTYVSRKFPELPLKLSQAKREETAQEFIQKILSSSLLIAGSIWFFITMMLLKFNKPIIIAIPIAAFTGVLGFFYLMKLPDMIILKSNKEVDREIVYAGKFLIVELNAGVTLYDALKTVAANYKAIGDHIKVLTNEVDLGTSIDEALNNAINNTTSQNLRKFLWQILNAHQTGSDIAQSLNSVLDQILREQMIEAEKYGKKLNPVAMFYLMIAVIIPSLGMVMAIIVASFMSIYLSIVALLLIWAFFSFVQFMFLAIIKSMRPAVQL